MDRDCTRRGGSLERDEPHLATGWHLEDLGIGLRQRAATRPTARLRLTRGRHRAGCAQRLSAHTPDERRGVLLGITLTNKPLAFKLHTPGYRGVDGGPDCMQEYFCFTI